MATHVEPRLPRGMRDILPQKMLRRRHVMRVIESVFERFGFEPLQTPALELSETLLGKYGPDAEKLIYDARHREGKEDLSLRYDLSVPLSRAVAMNPQLVKPFKRYQIAPVWRAERPQKGRYREFYQCDADTVGSASMLADAEIIAMIFAILTELGFRHFVTKLNNRKILAAVGEYSRVPPALLGALYRAIDKFDKIGIDGVREELARADIPDDAVSKIIDLIGIPGGHLGALRETLGGLPLAMEGIAELEQVLSLLPALHVDSGRVQVDFKMVRGLEYYTGPIFETVVTEPKIGSLTGGGRYDGLIGLFSRTPLPATGTTIGIERIIDVMDELRMFPPDIGTTVTQVLVTVFDATRRADSIEVASELRASGLDVELWLELDNLGKQLKYAAAKGIPFAIIIGPDEAAQGAATLRDLGSGEQQQFRRDELPRVIRERLPH